MAVSATITIDRLDEVELVPGFAVYLECSPTHPITAHIGLTYGAPYITEIELPLWYRGDTAGTHTVWAGSDSLSDSALFAALRSAIEREYRDQIDEAMAIARRSFVRREYGFA